MKRFLSVAFVVLVFFSATSVMAMMGPGNGPGGVNGNGFGMGGNFGIGGNQGFSQNTMTPQYMTPEVASKYLEFENAVLPIRERLLQLKIELLTLQAQTVQDLNAIKAKLTEIYNVRLQLMQEAVNYGNGFGMFGYGVEIGQ